MGEPGRPGWGKHVESSTDPSGLLDQHRRARRSGRTLPGCHRRTRCERHVRARDHERSHAVRREERLANSRCTPAVAVTSLPPRRDHARWGDLGFEAPRRQERRSGAGGRHQFDTAERLDGLAWLRWMLGRDRILWRAHGEQADWCYRAPPLGGSEESPGNLASGDCEFGVSRLN